MRIAVIGSGISGLASAYYLSRAHEVTLFESANRLGGHTHTVTVETAAGPLAIDMGFIVHNDRTYPNLVRLFAELGVPTQASDMSFSVFSRENGFEYSSRGLAGFLRTTQQFVAQRSLSAFTRNPSFNKEAPLSRTIRGRESLSANFLPAAVMTRVLSTTTCTRWPLPSGQCR